VFVLVCFKKKLCTFLLNLGVTTTESSWHSMERSTIVGVPVSRWTIVGGYRKKTI